MNIKLYKNTSDNIRVDKQNYLTLVDEINGTLRDETSMTNLVLTLEYYKTIDFNYCYIDDLNRYYYVNDIILINKNMYELVLSIDVLMSYKDSIKNLNAFVDRCESRSNNLIPDSKAVFYEGYDVEDVEIENDVFTINQSLSDYSYVIVGYKLNTIGGV